MQRVGAGGVGAMGKGGNPGQRGEGIAIINEGFVTRRKGLAGDGPVSSLKGCDEGIILLNAKSIALNGKAGLDTGVAARGSLGQPLSELGFYGCAAAGRNPAAGSLQGATGRRLIVDFAGLKLAQKDRIVT